MAKTIQMTKGPIARNMIFFILPLIGSGLCQQLYNTADFLFCILIKVLIQILKSLAGLKKTSVINCWKGFLKV